MRQAAPYGLQTNPLPPPQNRPFQINSFIILHFNAIVKTRADFYSGAVNYFPLCDFMWVSIEANAQVSIS